MQAYDKVGRMEIFRIEMMTAAVSLALWIRWGI